MGNLVCEHGRRVGKCADCEVQELYGEVSDLTEENARLREALGHMVRNFDYHCDRLDSAQCNSLDEAKQLLKGDEDE